MANEESRQQEIHLAAEKTEPAAAPSDVKTEWAYPVVDEAGELKGWKSQEAQEQFNRGNTLFDKRDFTAAVASYQKVIALEPENALTAEALYKLGRSYQELKLFKQAVSVYNELILKHPGSPALGEVHLAVGECYLEMDRIDDALRHFEIARDRFPPQRETAQEMIDTAASQQEPPEESE